jgi:hypothetical protein
MDLDCVITNIQQRELRRINGLNVNRREGVVGGDVVVNSARGMWSVMGRRQVGFFPGFFLDFFLCFIRHIIRLFYCLR